MMRGKKQTINNLISIFFHIIARRKIYEFLHHYGSEEVWWMLKVNKEKGKKAASIFVTVLLIGLILFVLIPPATSVNLDPGSLSSTEITLGNTITFQDVTLTIEGAEKIPITRLNFSIYNNDTDSQVGSVSFYADGYIITENPSNAWDVTLKTPIQDEWYGYGYSYGYDEPNGGNYYFGYGYGYGYGGEILSEINLIYDIEFTTQQSGSFYAVFSANSTSSEESHIFQSTQSETFTVSGIYFNQTFSDGWNLITLPVSTSLNASNIAQNISNCTMISWFDAECQTYRTHIVGSAVYNFTIEDGYGLFILVNQTAGTYLNVSGAEIQDENINITLYNTSGGWNMIGWYNSSSTNSSRISENISDATMIYGWNATAQDWLDYIVGWEGSDPFVINRGMGLFIQVSNQTYWHGEG